MHVESIELEKPVKQNLIFGLGNFSSFAPCLTQDVNYFIVKVCLEIDNKQSGFGELIIV